MHHAVRAKRRPSTPLAAVVAAIVCACGAAQAAEWPQFHGPRRDNLSDETGLLKQWPEGGPKKLWTAKGIGHGFSTVAIAGGLIYTTGNIGPDTVITALGLDGKPQWTAKNGPACRHDRPGARGTPTIDGPRLYHENADGDLVCLDARSGKRIWGLNILKKFKGRNTRWGLAESVLVDGRKLICVPGGAQAGVVALDKMTGEALWICKGTTDRPGYASPIVFEYGGVRQIATMMSRSVVGVHAGTGKLLWQQQHIAFADETVSTPIFHQGLVFVSTLRPGAAQSIKLTAQGDTVSAERAWQVSALDNHHGGVILVDGYLYGSSTRGRWVCLELKSGKVMYAAQGVGKGSLTYADGMLYTYSENRVAGLVKATPTGHEVISRFKIPAGGRGPSWAHPVVCGGRLYLRYDDFLHCYDIRRP
jgi:outer membrane protein assembly factor BamB